MKIFFLFFLLNFISSTVVKIKQRSESYVKKKSKDVFEKKGAGVVVGDKFVLITNSFLDESNSVEVIVNEKKLCLFDKKVNLMIDKTYKNPKLNLKLTIFQDFIKIITLKLINNFFVLMQKTT